jgi:hypothetical protein
MSRRLVLNLSPIQFDEGVGNIKGLYRTSLLTPGYGPVKSVPTGDAVRLPDSKDTSLERSRGIAVEVEVVESIEAKLVAASVGDTVIGKVI